MPVTNPVLSVELVPATSWGDNLRDRLTKSQWAKCKAWAKAKYRGKCGICGGVGTRYPVDCHEVWEYDDVRHIQTLVGLIALCPKCHAVKHIGRQATLGQRQFAAALVHLSEVNEWDGEQVMAYVGFAFEQHAARSSHQWQVDVTWLDAQGIV